MHAEIIAIGSEILLGKVVDTNSATIAKKLQGIGLPLHYTSTVGDDLERMVAVIRQGLARSNVVITTGGVGPTVDDLTREAMAQATGKPLVFDEALLRQIEERFRRWGRTMTANNRRQAFHPEGSIPIENPVGTAPCFIIDQDDKIAISLPGVPSEMEYLMDNSVLSFLRQRLNLNAVIKSRDLKVAGSGESLVDERVGDLEKLENPVVGLNAHTGVITIRVTATAANGLAAERLIAPVETTIRERLGTMVFGADAETLEGVVLAELSRRMETLAVVESGTGGRLSGKLAGSPAAPDAFVGGRIVGRPLSADSLSLARDAAKEMQADWGLACTILRKDQEIDVGLGLWNPAHAEQRRCGFGGHPALAPEWASNMALDYLRTILFAANQQ